MKPIVVLCLLGLAAFPATGGKRMRLHCTDGVQRTYLISDIDSITFQGIAGVKGLCLDSGAVRGWNGIADTCKRFDTLTLYHMINGAAPVYIRKGLIEGIYQEFVFEAVPERICYVYAEDFGTPDSAIAMMREKKSRSSMTDVVPGYDSTVAAARVYSGACSVIARFDRYYFEIVLSGFSDVGIVMAEAARFLGVYEALVGR